MKTWPARRRLRVWLIWSVPAAMLFAGEPAFLRAAPDGWLQGQALRQALERPVSLTWSNVSLRRAVWGLAGSQRVAILLDRRIDPDQKIELAIEGTSLREVLDRVAGIAGGKAVVLDSAVYIGPAGVANRLGPIISLKASELQRLAPAARGRWLRLSALAWDDLAEPRQLISQVAQRSGLKIANPEAIEHDLWGVGELPPMNLVQRLTVLLAQFDLTYEFDAGTRVLRLTPLPDSVRAEAARVPSGSSSGVGRRSRPAGPSGTREVYTLRVTMPVGKLLEQLAAQLKVPLRIEHDAIKAAGLSLDKEVQIEVAEVSKEELLHAAVEPAGLRLERREGVIHVLPKK